MKRIELSKVFAFLTIPSDEPSRAPPPAWDMTPRLRCSKPCAEALTKVEAKEGSSPSTTELPGMLTLLGGPGSDSSPKWDTTSDTVRAVSGSREMGGISNSSSPRLGVWNVCRAQRVERTGGGCEPHFTAMVVQRKIMMDGKKKVECHSEKRKEKKLKGMRIFLHRGKLSCYMIMYPKCFFLMIVLKIENEIFKARHLTSVQIITLNQQKKMYKQKTIYLINFFHFKSIHNECYSPFSVAELFSHRAQAACEFLMANKKWKPWS